MKSAITCNDHSHGDIGQGAWPAERRTQSTLFKKFHELWK